MGNLSCEVSWDGPYLTDPNHSSTTAFAVVFPSSSLTSISRRDLGMPWIPKATCSFLAWSASSTEIHHQAQSGTLGLSVRSLHSLVVWPPPRNESFSSFMSSEPNRSSGSSMRSFGWKGVFIEVPTSQPFLADLKALQGQELQLEPELWANRLSCAIALPACKWLTITHTSQKECLSIFCVIGSSFWCYLGSLQSICTISNFSLLHKLNYYSSMHEYENNDLKINENNMSPLWSLQHKFERSGCWLFWILTWTACTLASLCLASEVVDKASFDLKNTAGFRFIDWREMGLRMLSNVAWCQWTNPFGDLSEDSRAKKQLP